MPKLEYIYEGHSMHEMASSEAKQRMHACSNKQEVSQQLAALVYVLLVRSSYLSLPCFRWSIIRL